MERARQTLKLDAAAADFGEQILDISLQLRLGCLTCCETLAVSPSQFETPGCLFKLWSSRPISEL